MINLNKGEFKESMLESMELQDNETETMTAFFELKIKEGIDTLMLNNPGQHREKAPWFNIMRSAIWQTFRWNYIFTSFLSYFAELTSLVYSFMIMFIV